MIGHQRIGRSANRRGGPIAGFLLSLAAMLVLATPSFAQAPPEKTDKVAVKGKPKPISTPGAPSAASRAAVGPAPSQMSDTAQGVQAQNPLTPLWGVI
jgi:hypothetical protein